jgi:hypothetical protein
MKLFAGATIGLGLVAALFISFYLKLWYDVSRFSFSIPMGGADALWNSTIYNPLFWVLAILVFGAGVYFAAHHHLLN